ncbi:hypothetical protein TWF694_006751 [Orbilia ellipsospora]|uniref:Rhodanese domain-containing protein n=1 Tax=Orbilia ellipsospora TaxID=2528407 RepID=A0AAV9XL51_9PEZI
MDVNSQISIAPPAPWYSAYPAPRGDTPNKITRGEVLALLNEANASGNKDFVLVDVRRNDYEGGSIRGSINIPAQSFYTTISSWYTLFKAAGVKKVIWYCNSSRGRGTRSSLWFQDYIDDNSDAELKSMILIDGIKGWATGGNEYVERMDEYVESYWK